MDSPIRRTAAVPTADALSAIHNEIERLSGEQAKLRARREAIKRETLQSLADAFARKLQAAGLSVREGIQALRPYEKLKLDEMAAAAPATTTAYHRAPAVQALKQPSGRSPQVNARDAVEQQAQHILGAPWRSWLDQPHLLLGGEAPSALLANPAGVAKVRALLDAYGQSTSS